MPLTTLVAGNTARASHVNGNFDLCVLTDTSKTVTVTHTYSASQTFSAGWTAAAACTITAASATAFAVGRQGATDPVLLVHSSTASQATGIKITGAAAAGGVAVAAISSGTNEALTIDAKGSGTITLGGTSTGAITLTRATTISAALTYGGVTLSNAVTGTGNMVLSASPTLTGTAIAASLTLSGTLALAGATVSGTPTWSSSQAITLSTAAQPNVTSVGTLTSLAISGALTYGGVALSAAVTGTGNMVLSASPTFTGTVAAAAITASGTVTAKDGSAAAPSVVFSSDTSTGIYRAGSETMGFAAGGAVRATLSTAALTISSGVTLAAQAITGTTLDLTGNLSVAKASTSAAVTVRAGGAASNGSQVAFGHTSTTYWQTGYQIVGSAGEFEIYDTAAARVALKIATGATGMTTLTGGITATTGTFSGAVSGITTLAGSGAVSGFTSWTGTGLIQTTVTTEQMRLRYDASNYIKTVVGATGAATYTSVGTSPGIGFDIGSSIFLTINPQVFTFSGPGVNGLQIFNSALGNANTGNVYISNGTAPSGNPTTGGYLWVESGALKYRGSSGTVTTVANA